MRPIVLTMLLATVVFGGVSGVFAQSVVIDPDDRYYYEEYDESTIRVLPVRPRSCGEFRYWDGERCVDARVVPPDIQ